MYLQSLELIGFKSFAQKTILTFHSGVTAVVGPNGCGKSNVLDAMRWVLGEQSAKALRGGEMADVIFSGTDSRPPLGMAEVSLTFAECEKELGVDWNEVRITRRVFRDGNSEYLLNKTPCRLRDIHNLFMDTGIGRSAYSIMEQGKIDLILSSKPEDRRAIFEEAAGITKFKSQRREALRKLEATEANLLRVSDVVREVKRQIGSLQRQAGKARRYQALITDLKTLELHHARQQFESLDEAKQKAAHEIERLRELQTAQESQIEAEEGALAERRSALEELERDLNGARQVVQDLRNHIGNAENRIGFNRERVMEFASLMQRYERDIAAAQEKLLIQQTQIENTNLELEQIVGTLTTEQTRLDEKMRQVNELSAQRVERENAVQGLFETIAKVQNRLGSLRGELSSLASQRDGSETRMSILEEEIKQAHGVNEVLAQRHVETAAELGRSENALETQLAEGREAEEQTRSIAVELVATDQELAAENRLLAEKESKLEVLRQLNESGEGFAEGTQAVLRGLDDPTLFQPAVLGTLAAHIEVEPQFVPAVEAALGQNLQAVLVKDASVAQAVIESLARKKAGRATLALREFFPSSIENSALPEGAIAWAVDCIRADRDAQTLVACLLHNVVVVENLATAMRLRAGDLAFVTLAGETLSREGLLCGGINGKAGTSVLQRKNQIADLEREARQAQEKTAAVSTRRTETLERLEKANLRLSEARQETQKTSLAVSMLRGQLQALERDERDSLKKEENLGWERQNIETRHREAVEKLGAREAEHNQMLAKLEEMQTQQGALQVELDALRAREGERGGELGELRVKVATEKQRHTSLNDQRQPMAARLQELRDLIEQRHRDIEGYRFKSEQLEAETGQVRSEIEATQRKAAESEMRVNGLVGERAALAENIEALDSTLRIMRRQLSDCHGQLGQQEVKQTQTQLRLENLTGHISRRYQVELAEFKPDAYTLLCTLREQVKKERGSDPALAANVERESEQRIDWDRIEQIVADLNQRIDSMGPVNIDAIQEYDELEQRHTFLEKQLGDLNTSKGELLDVIAKINLTTKKMFAETFEKVRVNFQEMFTELFGGGKANLLLLDESDPLESGIDIIAKPPGKQLQSISLLSGGEKTMTAVALLFSIYMVKPSPFCVLDEMDAPLDESNINRFIKILDRFVSQSQFVVISHNKRTIAKADALYGVTMEEH
ncbi:MAG: chromosome segregation protein, partial [Chthoniobacter sp.]|nr:chromosome segregation protein [Chthoniobacter sp.]